MEITPTDTNSNQIAQVVTPNLGSMTPEELQAYIDNLKAQLEQAQALINNQ